MKKPKNYIIDVIPLTRIPLSRQQYFSYEFECKLPAGTLVEIPLFNRILNGIVINSRDDFYPHTKTYTRSKLQQANSTNFGVGVNRLGNIKLKKIVSVTEENFLTTEQLELAQFISDYYICPLGIVLKFFVPKRVKSRNPKPETQNPISKKIKLTKEQEEAVKKIVTGYGLQVTGFLLFGPASSGKTEVYIHAIAKRKAQSANLQFLVLLPELTLTPQALERYGAIFKPEEIAVIHSKIPKGEFYNYWQKIKTGEIKLVIGTRMAVFLPFKSLGLIVIDEEQDISFKQWDMSPRYDARTVAEELAEIFKTKIVRGSATPIVETYYKALSGEYKLLKLPELQIADYKMPVTDTEIVDMRKERWIKNYSPISKKLKSEIEYALKNKLQTILFINRQGMSAFSVCANCKTVLGCPKCNRALVYGNDGIYKCLHCNYKTGALATCPKCHGMIFKNIGLGTQKIEREIQKLFPGAKIKRADFETMKKRKSAGELYGEFMRADFDILIGTQMITKGWDNPKVELIGIIDADNLTSFPDYNSQEKAFQLMMQVAGRTGRKDSKFPGKVIIQTYNSENALFKALVNRNYQDFYENEIENRKLLAYPPYSQIIKLIFQNQKQEKVEKEAKKMYDYLRGKMVNPHTTDLPVFHVSNHSGVGVNLKSVKISRPQDPFLSKIRGRYRKQIVIKLNKSDFPQLKKHLTLLDGNWIIDIDPISLI